MSLGSDRDQHGDRKGPSSTRIVIWVAVSAFALYMIVSAIYGIVSK